MLQARLYPCRGARRWAYNMCSAIFFARTVSRYLIAPSFNHLNANKSRYVDYTYRQSSSKPFPFTKYPNIEALAFKVLQRFSKKMLSMAERGQQYAPSGNPRPLEATYQDEFYRCFGDEVGPDISIVSERSCVSRGSIDFQILAPGWGFEILRDGDRISEHCERFKPGGTYHQSIQQCVLSDWLILYFRRTSPRKTCECFQLYLLESL